MRWLYTLWLSPMTIALVLWAAPSPAQADTPEDTVNPFAFACPILLKPLLQEILPELPSYINRSIQRHREATDPQHYLLGFSPPDYRPASLADFSDRHPELGVDQLLEIPNLYQVFLTSAERVYDGDQMETFQEFHWLLFQQNDRYHWELRGMFSQDQQGNIRNSSTEPIAQGIQRRLQDCWRVE
ncbi:MAG: hypothetical protein ACO3NK_08390 [Prochlorotrichaceae cyanobacterium]|jgi:hypothetical protein